MMKQPKNQIQKKKNKAETISGWINLDKPYGMTSTQAVGKIRRLLNCQKIGHAGTLDPLATGILPIALGEATKTIPFIQEANKTYLFTIIWGEQRDTDDAEGQIIATSTNRPTKENIKSAIPNFMGKISQIPPLFSAIKINGARAYDLARAGKIPDLKPRLVYIKSIDLVDFNPNKAIFEMTCGKGTYVRSIARDMAEILETKGYIGTLRREKVGCFEAKDAISLDILETLDYQSAREKALLPLRTVLDDIPALALKKEETAKLRSGQILQFISRPDFERLEKVGLGSTNLQVALALFEGAPVALVENERAKIKPLRIFNL